MLKGRSLKSCAALVVFCFSLVVACISPAWADTTIPTNSPSDHAIVMYFSAPTLDPFLQGKNASIPVAGDFFVYKGTNVVPTAGINAISSIFQPYDYDVSLVYSFALVEGLSSFVTYSFSNASESPPVRVGSSVAFRSGTSSSATGNYVLDWFWLNNGVVSSSPSSHVQGFQQLGYVLPAGTNCFYIYSYPYSISSVTGEYFFTVNSCYLVHSAEPSIVDQVNAILAEVKKVNGNLSSTLSVLNQILAQCQAIKADTASILSLLQLCQSQLVTLNGKVDDIYKLLKDSLAQEAGVVDKKSEELGGQIMQRVDSEQYWNDKNTENFNALDMGNWTFGDGVVGALPTVGNLFKSLWDSIGDATLIFVFPLMLGIALVIVGRVSRTAGKGQKKGGGDDG